MKLAEGGKIKEIVVSEGELRGELREPTRYAMEPSLGQVACEANPRSHLGPGGDGLRPHLCDDDTAREIDCAIRRIVLSAFERAVAALRSNRDVHGA
ncbi:MAG: hypothetical protein JW751_32635 [Polyangiaceae bacterium]|nr:hypothetical protein [Polyangiaceae bacterium]